VQTSLCDRTVLKLSDAYLAADPATLVVLTSSVANGLELDPLSSHTVARARSLFNLSKVVTLLTAPPRCVWTSP
jgi:hypothetical protein